MVAQVISAAEFERWLQAYGDAWIDRSPDAVVKLFSPDAAYHDEPFEEPMIGHAAIHQY